MEGGEIKKNPTPVTGLTGEQKNNVVDGLVNRGMISLTPYQLEAVRKLYPKNVTLKTVLADIISGRIVVPKIPKR